MTPGELEALAREILERADAPGFALAVVPGSARAGTGGLAVTIALAVEKPDGTLTTEREVWLVPDYIADTRVAACIEGIAVAFQRLARTRPDHLAKLTAHELIPWRGMRDPACASIEEFAAAVGIPEPAIDDILEDDSGTMPIARDDALERAIDDAGSIDAFLVYADWLAERGDPRGELISCTRPGATPEARRRAADLIARHARYFGGPFLASGEMSRFVPLHFELGYFDEIAVVVDHDLEDVPDFAPRVLQRLLELPSSRFVRHLTLGWRAFRDACHYDTLYPILARAGVRRSLQRLDLGVRAGPDSSDMHAGDLAPLVALYPNLTSLRVHAGTMQLAGALAYPKLATLAIQTGALTGDHTRAIANATLPALTSLELWFGARYDGATAELDDIAPILASKRLSRLALQCCEWADTLVEALVCSAVLPQLRELDLSGGLLSDAGVETLLANQHALAHLTKLDVHDNRLGEAARHALSEVGQSLGIAIDTAWQKQQAYVRTSIRLSPG